MKPNAVREVLRGNGISVPPDGGPARPVCDEMLTATELAARLKTTTRTIDFWRTRGVLPVIRVGKALLFHWPTVVAHLLEKYQEREPCEARLKR